jgi:hypothetical protein
MINQDYYLCAQAQKIPKHPGTVKFSTEKANAFRGLTRIMVFTPGRTQGRSSPPSAGTKLSLISRPISGKRN